MKPDSLKIPCRCSGDGPKTGLWESKGRFYRKSDSKWIARWRCRLCRFTFSEATFHPCFGQKKRRINEPLFRLLCSGVSLRRSAKLLGVHRTTVVRKFRFLAEQARLNQVRFWNDFSASSLPLHEVQFDEVETFEHSKMKPLSIALLVTRSRHILGAEVASMPAKGPLADKSRKKYGRRKDKRSVAMRRLLEKAKLVVSPQARFQSDQNPHYPVWLQQVFPEAIHETTKGLRGCVVGQGELKATSWDPLFALNHTAAMLRANMNRLFRRTWCTTKTIRGLEDHLALYIDFHNQLLLQSVHS